VTLVASGPETEQGGSAGTREGTALGDLSMPPPKAAGLRSWFAELKRRRVFRALVAYGIASFAVLQIIEPIMHGAHWPEIVLSYVVAGLAAGFPIVITLAWIFDVKAGRIERTAPAPAATGLRGIRLALLLVGIGVLSAAPGLFYYFVVRGGGRSLSTEGNSSASTASSIAVLPFLSSGEENAYFAQGFHDELLRQLGRIGDLRVISRTSVMQYKEGARNSREIAEALGVSSIVEGSVQRAGNRVRVEARLIDARNDRQMWGDRYDRNVTDIFAIQTAVAEEIAKTLQARLSPAQKAQIDRKPTQSTEAYDLYLRALEYTNRPGSEPENLAIAGRLYRKAIDADPSFALARARLADVTSRAYLYQPGKLNSVAEEAKEQAEKALQLQPDLPEAHLAMGMYFYGVPNDFDRALAELEIARAGVPGEATFLIAVIMKRQGKIDEAIRHYQMAARLDPRQPDVLLELATMLRLARRYEEADQVSDRALMIAPDYAAASMNKALLHEAWKGETDLAKSVLRDMVGRFDRRGRLGVQESTIIPLLMHNPREALVFLESVQADSLTGRFVVPKAFLYACAHEALGDAPRARKEYEAALPSLEAEVQKSPSSTGQHTILALAYAGLDRKQEALREVGRAVELLPMHHDVTLQHNTEINRAQVEARVGETDAAIEHIRYLLSIPCQLSPALLRIDPRWAPLRADPRFQKLAELE